MSDCPLKEAARDAPNQLAILSRAQSFTFAELDRYVDSLPLHLDPGDCLPLKEPPSAHLIALFFAAWRRSAAVFPVHLRFPQAPSIAKAPPRSVLLLTSGSTGTPKIALLSLENLLASAKGAIPALDLRQSDQWLLSLPLYHVGGLGIVIRCLLARATIVLDDSPHITHLSYVPTQLYRATPVYKQLRCLLLGGAPIASIPERLPISTTYGLTEMSSLVTLNGQVLPGREVRISEDREIWVRGPCLFQGYLGAAPQRDWFPTGDLGRFCPQRGLLIEGRKDWMFISGGENIQPEEIERELLALPQVGEAVVLPVDDAEFGKRPVAVVRATAPFDLKQMQTALRERLPKYKIPIALYLVDEVPKTNNFKVNRFILSQHIRNQSNENRPGQKKEAYL